MRREACVPPKVRIRRDLRNGAQVAESLGIRSPNIVATPTYRGAAQLVAPDTNRCSHAPHDLHFLVRFARVNRKTLGRPGSPS